MSASEKYRGFSIHTRKKENVEQYYAWIYYLDQQQGGFKVDSRDSREEVFKLAKKTINTLLAKLTNE